MSALSAVGLCFASAAELHVDAHPKCQWLSSPPWLVFCSPLNWLSTLAGFVLTARQHEQRSTYFD